MVALCAFSCLCARCRGRSCNQSTQPKSLIFCIDICFSAALLYLGAHPAAAKTAPLQAPALQTSSIPSRVQCAGPQGGLKAQCEEGRRPCCQGFDLHKNAFKSTVNLHSSGSLKLDLGNGLFTRASTKRHTWVEVPRCTLWAAGFGRGCGKGGSVALCTPKALCCNRGGGEAVTWCSLEQSDSPGGGGRK